MSYARRRLRKFSFHWIWKGNKLNSRGEYIKKTVFANLFINKFWVAVHNPAKPLHPSFHIAEITTKIGRLLR